jgi:hypothetical protein
MTLVEKYRQYYLEDKWHIGDWKNSPPSWWPKDHTDIKTKQRKQVYANMLEEFRRIKDAL